MKVCRHAFLSFGVTLALAGASIVGCGQGEPSARVERAPTIEPKAGGSDEATDGDPVPDPPWDPDSCGPGQCIDGGYCDACACYSPDSNVSVAMCLCGLLDPACGLGFCDNGAYCTGSACADSLCYPPDSPISMTMCQRVALDPVTCEPETACHPESLHFQAGVFDDFSQANGAESPSPSPGLLQWIAATYPGAPAGSRDFDDLQYDWYFAHTFTGLAPQNGAYICGARLHTRAFQHESSFNNDWLGLRFADANGDLVGPSWDDTLANLGVPSGTLGDIVVDLAGLPNGAAFLLALQNGWLDVVFQDDTVVDHVALDVDYCCPCDDPHTPQLTGIVGYWSLDEPAGPISADLIQGNNGTWSGAPHPTPGIGCGALEFDGLQDHEITSSAPALNFGTGDFSISFYATMTDTGLNVILDKRVEASGPVRGWCAFTYNGNIAFQLGDGAYTNFGTNTFLADGQKHHVAITVRRGSPTGLKVYVDKVLTDVFNPTGHPGSVSNKIPMTIGRRSDHPAWPGFFPGNLDEISLYDRALTAAEIQSL